MSGRGGGGGSGGGSGGGVGPVGGLVRQMSLHTPPTQRRPLARQASEDIKDYKDLWGASPAGRSSPRPAPGTRRTTSARPASGGHQQRRSSASPMRPRPVRLAWAASPTPPHAGPGELVAKRCPSAQPRPAPASHLLPSRGDIGVAMSRQQLAERLRRAWQDRRPSLDIFLASTEPHEDVDDDAQSLSSSRSVRDEPVERSLEPAGTTEPSPVPCVRPALSPTTIGTLGRAGRGRAVLRPRGSTSCSGSVTVRKPGLSKALLASPIAITSYGMANDDTMSVCSISSEHNHSHQQQRQQQQQQLLLETSRNRTPLSASLPPCAPSSSSAPPPAPPTPTTPRPPPASPLVVSVDLSPPPPSPPSPSPPAPQTAKCPGPGAGVSPGSESASGERCERCERHTRTTVLMRSQSESDDSVCSHIAPGQRPGPPPPQPPPEPHPEPHPGTRASTPVTASTASGTASGTASDTASARRLQFRNSGKTFISVSTSSAPASAPVSSRPRTAGSSRPSSSSSLSLSSSSAPPPPKGILVNRSRLQSAGSVDVLDTDATPRALALAAALASGRGTPTGTSTAATAAANGRVKSAPPARARKLKTAAARRGTGRLRNGGGHSDSSRDSSRERDKDKEKDKDEKDKKGGARNGRRGRVPTRVPSEVVTMVSLLSASESSADSDAEAEAHPSGPIEVDRFPGLLSGTTFASLRTSATGLSPSTVPSSAAAPPQPYAADRKPKSVWFQAGGMPLRRVGPELSQPPALGLGGTLGALVAGAGLDSGPAGYGHGLASEKRSPSVEARTAKRRLTRTLSEPTGPILLSSDDRAGPGPGSTPLGLQIPLSLLLRATGSSGSPPPEDDDDSGEATPANAGARSGPGATPASQDEDDGEGSEEGSEPTFSTPKERECWQLFKKMSDKGITVSYDTVLRGMLTPTEYRMRRNSLLTGC